MRFIKTKIDSNGDIVTFYLNKKNNIVQKIQPFSKLYPLKKTSNSVDFKIIDYHKLYNNPDYKIILERPGILKDYSIYKCNN